MYIVEETKLKGCFKIIPRRFSDHRGTSVKPFHMDEFIKLGLQYNFEEDLIVTSYKNVLRGMHFQNPPYAQGKLVYCIKGNIMDVVIDIRNGSSTYGKHEVFSLTGSNNNIIYIPEGFAHGYLSLDDDSIVMYKMLSVYKPEFESGIRWDSLGINWGFENPIISERDMNFVPFEKFDSKFIYR